MSSEFSYASRRLDIDRLRGEVFDFLVVGGGITGAATARDAASRGLKVALVEKEDFASGTSSASSKLVHGGLRYLENLEFKLVFESLSERAHLIRTQPNMVRWLKFYLPVYDTDARGMNLVSTGLWLYDALSLLRAPHFHKRLSRAEMLRQVPGLKEEGLLGGFTYYDASMWDDVMCVENARAARRLGAAVASRVEAVEPVWEGESITGFRCRDRFDEAAPEIVVRAKRTIVCGGPFADRIGESLLRNAPESEAARFRNRRGEWKSWLKPSRGTHLVFAKDRLPVQGAMLLSNPEDGRISFVIPREDFGPGVVIVGTTDGPSPEDPSQVRAEEEDVDYLIRLLARYFPKLGLVKNDIVSRYVGVRPLMDPAFGHEEGSDAAKNLASVSREHVIDRGPGGTTFVGGGKYTTHRTMALEIVNKALAAWTEDAWKGRAPRVPRWRSPRTDGPVNPAVTKEAVAAFLRTPIRAENLPADYRQAVPDLVERYGADAAGILQLECEHPETAASPEGFPYLEAQLRHAMREELVLRLEDFFFRRLPLYLARKDHGDPWIDRLAGIRAEELRRMGAKVDPAEPAREAKVLREKIARRDQGYRG
jgi:glycerol-3-phosphate dehydrogenase